MRHAIEILESASRTKQLRPRSKHSEQCLPVRGNFQPILETASSATPLYIRKNHFTDNRPHTGTEWPDCTSATLSTFPTVTKRKIQVQSIRTELPARNRHILESASSASNCPQSGILESASRDDQNSGSPLRRLLLTCTSPFWRCL